MKRVILILTLLTLLPTVGCVSTQETHTDQDVFLYATIQEAYDSNGELLAVRLVLEEGGQASCGRSRSVPPDQWTTVSRMRGLDLPGVETPFEVEDPNFNCTLRVVREENGGFTVVAVSNTKPLNS